MNRFSTVATLLSVSFILGACGSSPPAAAPHAGALGAATTAGSPSSSPSPGGAWPAGLVPCAKDAPAGEGCATGPAKNAHAEDKSGLSKPGADETVWNVPVGPDDPTLGPPNAPVTLVVFSDFECPFCRRGAETLTKLRDTYPNDVRVVWKDLPLPMHEHAEAAAEVARVARAQAGDAGFWAAHDALYAAQPDLSDASLRAIAEKLTLKWSDVRAAIRGARFGAIIRADVTLSDRTDVQATPTTFVNGRKITGAQPFDTVRAVIDAELDKARRRIAGGTPAAELYATVIQRGRQINPQADSPAP